MKLAALYVASALVEAALFLLCFPAFALSWFGEQRHAASMAYLNSFYPWWCGIKERWLK